MRDALYVGLFSNKEVVFSIFEVIRDASFFERVFFAFEVVLWPSWLYKRVVKRFDEVFKE